MDSIHPMAHDEIEPSRLAGLVAKYTGRGPRYTSYPPATCFRPDVDRRSYEERLGRLPEAAPLSLYVHLPFCAAMCSYCGCNVIVARDSARADEYLDLLQRELELLAQRLQSRRLLSQIHLGGGTPTFLSVPQIERLGRLIGGAFEIAASTEASVEVDPCVTSEEQLALLRTLGFNRLSAGLQDLEPAVQQAIGRIQSFEVTAGLLSIARRLGFRSVNLDLMYGLPLQTEETIGRTMEGLAALRPERIALFGYAHVPWVKPHQRRLEAFPLPGPIERVRLFQAASQRLRAGGYTAIGLDHFARPEDDLARAVATGELRRNFQGYTARPIQDTIAVGLSGIGDLAGVYVQNHHRLGAYATCLGANELPVERGHVLTKEDRMRRTLIDQLMCRLDVNVRDVASRFEIDPVNDLAEEWTRLDALALDGIVELERGRRIRVTELGRLFLRTVALVFDRYGAGAASPELRYSTMV